ncbi:uncharacterized protein LOC132322153 isoform X2 [Haemorhous mexicanus]|uniref:uncharacterized protein LOC132322153 isoform X2 n=1 Tax=Haemorhous mexicanus TaxID=30427 RepID=UPI0028BDE3B1|nr:uncharacterized protein LOC132322153 isoform X2 [Haemorhous mexicanus]
MSPVCPTTAAAAEYSRTHKLPHTRTLLLPHLRIQSCLQALPGQVQVLKSMRLPQHLPRKCLPPPDLLGFHQPGTQRFQLQSELIIPPVPVDQQNTSVASTEISSCTSPEQHLPAYSPSATPDISAPSTPAGSTGFAAWTAPSWLWNSPGKEELLLPDLDMVLETLEEMFAPSAQGNSHVAPESSGGEPVDRAAAEGALPGTKSCGNYSQEPKEFVFDRRTVT